MRYPLPLGLLLGFGSLLLSASWAVAGGDEAPADGATRIQELEKEMRSLREEFDAYRRTHPPRDSTTPDQLEADIETYLGTSGAGVPESATNHGLRLGGYTTVAYINGDSEPSRFDLDRLVFSFAGGISEGVDFLAEIEFEGGGITDEFQGEIGIEQAIVTFRISELFNPKFGWVLVPFGRYNLYHDDPLNDFTVRPFTARFLVPTGFGQPGIGTSGSKELGAAGHVLSYDVVLTNGFMDGFNAEEGTGEARQNRDNNDGKQVWGRVAFQPRAPWFEHLEVGVSGTYGVYDDDDDDAVSGYAFDLLVRKGPFECKGDYIVYDIERSAGDPAGAVRGQSGFWIEGGWHFFPPAWRTPIRGLVTETSSFVLAVRYQRMNLDDAVSGATFNDDLSAFSLGLNYKFSERTVLRFDYTWFFPEFGSDQGEFTFSLSTYF